MIEGVTRTSIVCTNLPEGALVLRGMNGEEGLGEPFNFRLDLLSDDGNLGLSEILGQRISVSLEMPNGPAREFNGIVTEFWLDGAVGRSAAYYAVVRPTLWLMNHRVGSRIYQHVTVPDVIQKLFREHGFSDFTNALTEDHRKFEFLVQYRESDFAFVSRLMALEGIYYFFKHHDGKHELVLADSVSAHEAASGYESVPFYPPQKGERRERDHIDNWRVRRSVRPGTYKARDFNFTRPSSPIDAETRSPLDHAENEFPVYDYPGKYENNAEADVQVRVRLEEIQAEFERIEGAGNARGLSSGGLFKLTNHPREDQNKEYLIVHASHRIVVGSLESQDSRRDGPDYRVRFFAQESTRAYRSPTVAEKPKVGGPQTATVVGPSDKEIWTDEYGRVLLQFHWDREGQRNEESSCWVRVSQAWAGTNWGAIHIPRIGQEVIVEFLEGDPDRPIITGRVYNADNMPPYALPANQTQSGIKSRSTKGGTPDNFNEIRFEDLKGEEELYLQAEKNMTTLVKNDQSTSVKGSRSASVDGSDSVSVGGDRSESITGNLSVTVKGSGDGPTQSSLSVTGKHDVSASDTIEMSAPTHIKFTVGGTSILIEPGKITLAAVGGGQVEIDPNVLLQSSAGSSMMLDGDAVIAASTGGSVAVTADVLAASSGGTQIMLDGNAAVTSPGDVILDGANVMGTAQTEASLAVGGSAVTLSSASADVGGPMVNVNGESKVAIAAPMITVG